MKKEIQEECDPRISALVAAEARRAGIIGDLVQDCVQEFDIKWLLVERSQPEWLNDRQRREAILQQALRNHVVDFLRGFDRRSRREAYWTELLFDEDQAGHGGALVSPNSAATNPETAAARNAFWETIERGLSQLRPSQRSLLIRRHLLGLSVPELAAQAGCSVTAMDHRLSQARGRLRARLDELGVGEAQLRALCADH